MASTLICLSELVPILGADTVIGGKRSKLFTDGRPTSNNVVLSQDRNMRTSLPSKSLKELACSEEILCDSNDMIDFNKSLIMRERPSPVGGEDLKIENNDPVVKVVSSQIEKTESDDDWEDWDNTNRQLVLVQEHDDNDNEKNTNKDISDTTAVNGKILEKSAKSSMLHKAALQAKKNILDISELDIKNQKCIHSNKTNRDEFDFFADMTPVIEKTVMATVNTPVEISSKLNFVSDAAAEETGDWEDNWNDSS